MRYASARTPEKRFTRHSRTCRTQRVVHLRCRQRHHVFSRNHLLPLAHRSCFAEWWSEYVNPCVPTPCVPAPRVVPATRVLRTTRVRPTNRIVAGRTHERKLGNKPMLRRTLAAALATATLAAASPAAAEPSTPIPSPDLTALCSDGTGSYSQHRSGTCSHHGGVAQWCPCGSGTGQIAYWDIPQ